MHAPLPFLCNFNRSLDFYNSYATSFPIPFCHKVFLIRIIRCIALGCRIAGSNILETKMYGFHNEQAEAARGRNVTAREFALTDSIAPFRQQKKSQRTFLESVNNFNKSFCIYLFISLHDSDYQFLIFHRSEQPVKYRFSCHARLCRSLALSCWKRDETVVSQISPCSLSVALMVFLSLHVSWDIYLGFLFVFLLLSLLVSDISYLAVMRLG